MRPRLLLAVGALLLLVTAVVYAGTETTSGTIYNQNGQWADAVKILRVAIEKDPKDSKAHYQIAFAYSNLDSVALAYNHFMKAKELDPKKARDVANNIQSNYAKHYKLGQNHFTQKLYSEAAREFGLATQADPMQSSAHYNLAVTYSRLAETDSTYDEKTLAAANKVLELAPKTDPNYTRAVQMTARQLAAVGREAEAAEKAQPLLDADPTNFTTVEEIGTDLFNREKWKGALIFLKMAADARAKTGQSDFTNLFNIGLAEFKLRSEDSTHVDSCIVYYEKALLQQPEEAAATFNLMGAYMVKKDWTNASVLGEKYVSLSPADPKGWQRLASVYAKLGDEAKATEAYQRYQQLNSGGGQ